MRYSLAAHPYDWERELDPLARGSDAELLVHVAGYKELDKVGDLCDRALKEKRPVYFFVKGRDGSGRSSAARFIIASYCDRRKLQHERLIVPTVGAEHSDALGILKEWMTELFDEIDNRRITIPDELQRDFADAIKASSLEEGKPKFLKLARRVAEELNSFQAGFAVCLERVTDGRVVKAVIDILKKTQTVCVFTTGDYKDRVPVSEAFDEAVKQEDKLNKNLTLTPLRGADVRAIVDQRWQKTTKVDNPFDLPGIEQIFDDKERSVKRILYLIERFLSFGAGKWCLGEPGWPTNKKLGLQVKELAVWLPNLERNPPL